jgi:O-antigen/teichoic acid export membrane protein
VLDDLVLLGIAAAFAIAVVSATILLYLRRRKRPDPIRGMSQPAENEMK